MFLENVFNWKLGKNIIEVCSVSDQLQRSLNQSIIPIIISFIKILIQNYAVNIFYVKTVKISLLKLRKDLMHR